MSRAFTALKVFFPFGLLSSSVIRLYVKVFCSISLALRDTNRRLLDIVSLKSLNYIFFTTVRAMKDWRVASPERDRKPRLFLCRVAAKSPRLFQQIFQRLSNGKIS